MQVLMCVLLMLAVNVLTLLVASPVPVARDTVEMVPVVRVSDIAVGRGWQMILEKSFKFLPCVT